MQKRDMAEAGPANPNESAKSNPGEFEDEDGKAEEDDNDVEHQQTGHA